MKKYCLLFCITLLPHTILYAANADEIPTNVSKASQPEEWERCFAADAVFPSKKLRYGHTYTFFNDIGLNEGPPFKIKNAKVSFFQPTDYGNSPKFEFTDWIKEQKGIVSTKKQNAYVKSEPYTIDKVMDINLLRQNTNKKFIILIYHYDYKSVDPQTGTEFGVMRTHKDCQYYHVSWCGDGQIDADYGEECDPNDIDQKEWGSKGCSAQCKPMGA